MQIGKLNIRKWTYDKRKLVNPILICWKLILYFPLIISLAIFSVLIGLFHLDFQYAIDKFKNNLYY